MGGAVPEHGECPSCAGLWGMPELCRNTGDARAVPDHGECPSCAGSWGMPELCRIMENAHSCAGSWEIAE